MALGGIGWVVAGTPDQVADELEDGSTTPTFNLAYALMPGAFVDIFEHLEPELQRRKRYKGAYRPVTLRHKSL